MFLSVGRYLKVPALMMAVRPKQILAVVPVRLFVDCNCEKTSVGCRAG